MNSSSLPLINTAPISLREKNEQATETQSCNSKYSSENKGTIPIHHDLYLFRVQGKERVVHPALVPGHPIVHPLPEVTVRLERLLHVR